MRRAAFIRHTRSVALALVLTGCETPDAECETDFALGIVVVHGEEDVGRLPRVTEIHELHVVGSDLEDLSDFACLTTANKIVIEKNQRLRSLAGLENLVDVGRPRDIDEGIFGWNLEIRENAALVSLDGLAALEHADSLLIERNPALVSVALPSLRKVDLLMRISGNDALEHIVGLTVFEGSALRSEFNLHMQIGDNDELKTIEFPRVVGVEGIDIAHNPALSDLRLELLARPRLFRFVANPELPQLPRSGPGLAGYCCEVEYEIAGNARLLDLRELQGLDVVDRLAILDNDRLSDLHGLEQLEVALETTISRNPALRSLAALDPDQGGSLVTVEQLEVANNRSLSQCEADLLEARLRRTNEDFRGRTSSNDTTRSCVVRER